MTTLQFDDGPFSGVNLEVVQVSGREAVNELYRFSVLFAAVESVVQDALTGGEHGVERTLLRARARLTLGEEPAAMERYALVSAASYLGVADRDGVPYATFRVELVPSAWLLTQRRRSRVFQRMFSHEIISQVLGDAGARHSWNLGNKYPRRLYCLQYDETDWDFVSRLLAEEGMFFFFQHTTDFGAPGAPGSPEKSTWDKVKDWVTGTGAPALAGAGKAAQKVGEAIEVGGLSVAGQAAQVVADLFTPPPADEELLAPENVPPGGGGPPGAGDVFVFGDLPSHYAHSVREDGNPRGLTLTRRNERGQVNDSYTLFSFGASGAVRPDRVENRDYDFRRPLLLLRAVHPPDARALAPAEGSEVYFHHGEYERPDVAGENSALQLEQHRRRALLHHGRGNCPRVIPGHLLAVENGTTEAIATGQFAVLRVFHEALNASWIDASEPDRARVDALARGVATAIRDALEADEGAPSGALEAAVRAAVEGALPQVASYRNRVEFVSPGFPARPPRPPRPMRNVVETATVVGPRGEAIYTDRYGRIKIQFHWDRDNQWNEASSCWVRVTQPWSGAGFGFQFVPRVGMEVLVAFVAGDPDRPVVVGTLYNGTHEPPEPLPERKSRSAIRSQTVRTDETDQAGAGFNEIAFEDAAGVERLVFHAQKDLEEVVNDSHQTTVRGEQMLVVGASQSVGIGRSQRVGVTESQVLQVGGAQFDNVGGSRTARVAGNETRLVDGHVLEAVRGTTADVVQGDAVKTVHGSSATSVHGDMRVTVGGTSDDPSSIAAVVGFVHGISMLNMHSLIVSTSDMVGATPGVMIMSNPSSLIMSPEKLDLTAKKITIHATEKLVIIGKDATLTMDGDGARLDANPITLATNRGSSLILKDAAAKLHGSNIQLVPASQSTSASQTNPANNPDNVHIKFTHGVLGSEEPMADVPYRVMIGMVFHEDKLDPGGVLNLYADPALHTLQIQLFPWRVEKYKDLYPITQGPLEFLVEMRDDMPASNSLPGARAVLRNIGFDTPLDLMSDEDDAGTREALETFQRWNKLRPTGHLDDKTTDKIPGYEG